MVESGVLPVLFVVDHDPNALDVLLSDLSRRFGNDFTVRGRTSAGRGADRAPRASGCRPTGSAAARRRRCLRGIPRTRTRLHPRAKRVLLVDRDYSSTSPAVQAMTLGRVDYHIVRPWANDETMYRAISEYLVFVEERTRAELRGVPDRRRTGDSRALKLRDVMTRFSMPFKFYAVDSDAGRRLLDEAGLDATSLPVVIRYDGQVIIDPGLPDLARAIGVSVKNDIEACELAIVGAGPAGLTAAVYAASEGLETVLLGLAVSGGQAGTSPLIRNYPGFPHGIAGGALMERTCEQAWLMGAHIIFAQQAVALERHGADRVVRLLDGTQLRARAVVIATGIKWRRLGVPRLEALVGAGVFYGAAVSESRAMHNQNVFIVGAGNSAGQAALHLAKYARAVTLVARGDSLAKSMSSYLIGAIESAPNIAVRLHTEVVNGGGEEVLEYLQLADHATGTFEEVPAAALFIMIGGEPHTQWLPDEITRDRHGYLITGRDLLQQRDVPWNAGREPFSLETSMPGVFAAGDARHGSIKRVASAVGGAATAVRLVHDYLREYEPTPAAQ